IDAIAEDSLARRVGNDLPVDDSGQSPIGAHPKLAFVVLIQRGRDFIGQPVAYAEKLSFIPFETIDSIIRCHPKCSERIFADALEGIAYGANAKIGRADDSFLAEAAQAAPGRDADIAQAVLANAAHRIVAQASSLPVVDELAVLKLAQPAFAADPKIALL